MFRPLLACLVLAAATALSGCAGLAQDLGVTPKAEAPAYSGVGVLVLGSDNTLDKALGSMRIDQSGATGATGSAKADATQTVEIPQEVIDSMIGAAQALLAAGNPAGASGVLDALVGTRAKAKTKTSGGADAKTHQGSPPGGPGTGSASGASAPAATDGSK